MQRPTCSRAVPTAPATRSGHRWLAVGILTAAAVLLRSPAWGNPLFGDDEEFYPLVGYKLLHGIWPYIGIWDRKPFGLFALFAAMQAGGGDPALVTQLFATAAAVGTALLVHAIAMQRVGRGPAMLAALFYLVMLEPLAGGATQTAVFYNLLLTGAAYLLLGAISVPSERSGMGRASLAMLLCGLAIQIKTNAALEGAAMGLWFVLSGRHGSRARAAGRALLLTSIGLAPTLLVGVGYWLAGHGADWWFANFASQFLKQGGVSAESLGHLRLTLVRVSPLLLGAALGVGWSKRDPARDLLAAWSAAAVIDALSIGNFWTFYWLPFSAAASILSATLFARPRWGVRAFWLFTLPATLTTVPLDFDRAAHARDAFARTLAAIPADVPSRCMLTYDVPIAYLQASGACLVTPYIFIDQLRSAAEAHALPVDASEALRRALARRPGVILTLRNSRWKLRNRVNDAILAAALRQGYQPTAIIPQRRWASDPESVVVWRRRDLLPD